MRLKDIFDGYTVNTVLDEEGDYLAYFAELPNVSAFGNTPEEAMQELENAWNLMKKDYKASGKETPVYTNETIGKIKIIEDFLPPPEELILKEETVNYLNEQISK